MDHSIDDKNKENARNAEHSLSNEYNYEANEIIAGAHRPEVPFQLKTDAAATQAIQKKAEGDNEEITDEKEELLHTTFVAASGDESPVQGPNHFNPAEMDAPPFQLKAEHSGQAIQRDEPPGKPADEPKVKGGKITPVFDDTGVTNHSGTYNEISKEISSLPEAGSVVAIMPKQFQFNENADKKTVSTTFTVKILKTMPKWTEYASIKASIKDEKDEKEKSYKERMIAAWDMVYASINAHEEEHKKDEKKIYTDLNTEIQGKTESEATDLINEADAKGKAQELIWHANKASIIAKWPIVEKEPTKVP